MITTRHPHTDEVPEILRLFKSEVRAGTMLPRTQEEIEAHLDHWLVAVAPDGIIGCVSLVFFDGELCEVRSLAVHSRARGNGVGAQLIEAAVDLAHTHGMQRVLTLTRSASLFERLNFQRDMVANYPEKVWRDCAPCPLKEMCDEVALVYVINHGERA